MKNFNRFFILKFIIGLNLIGTAFCSEIDFEALQKIGEQFIENKRFQDAIDTFDCIFSANTASKRQKHLAQVYLAKVHLYLGSTDKALWHLKYLKRAATSYPEVMTIVNELFSIAEAADILVSMKRSL